MADQISTRDKLLSLLAHQPRNIMNGMIKITTPATPSSLERSPSLTASLGKLDDLPLELLHSIFSMLDLQTLSRITRTCMRGTATVRSLLEYRDLMRHAPRAMAALASTRLIRHYSAATLYTTLLSAACSSCGEFGPFLSLLTAERCCYECLWRNQSLWVIPISEARRCFDLSAASVKQLRAMRSLPGKYCIGFGISRMRSTRLVSVRAAKELAFEEGKSAERLAQMLENRRTAETLVDYYTHRWLQAAPLQPPGPELAMRPSQANVPNDKYCGMASVPFPSLLAGGPAEHGIWCLGCEKLHREWSPNRPNEAVSRLAAPGRDVERVLNIMQHLARSETRFFEHLKHCPGAREMVPDLNEELRRMQQQ